MPAATYAKGARVTGEARDQLKADLVKRYNEGESIRALATEAGRSYGFVQGLLKEADVTLRQRGGATRGGTATAPRRPATRRTPAQRAATAPAEPDAAAEEQTSSKRKGKLKSEFVVTKGLDGAVIDVKPKKGKKAKKAKKAKKGKDDKAKTKDAKTKDKVAATDDKGAKKSSKKGK